MNMDLLKQQQNRGLVIAGGAAIIAFIAFFLPYVTASYLGISASASGASGGWLWFEEIAAIVSIAVAAVLLFRNNAFGLSNMPVDKQVRLGRITLLSAAILALLLHLLFLLSYQSQVGGLGTITSGFSIGLGFGWFLFLIASIGMVVGAVMAYRQPITTAYAASQPYGQPYPGQPTQYPPYQQPYPTTDQQQQYPPYQSAPQQYPQQPQQPYQQQYPSQPQQYPPTEMQQPPQQYPPQQR